RVVQLAGDVTGVDVEPVDLALAAVGFLHGGVEDLDGAGGDAGRPADVAADAVAAQQADDRVVGDVPAGGGVNGGAGACGGGGGVPWGGGVSFSYVGAVMEEVPCG